jgi:hypothetical protein
MVTSPQWLDLEATGAIGGHSCRMTTSTATTATTTMAITIQNPITASIPILGYKVATA